MALKIGKFHRRKQTYQEFLWEMVSKDQTLNKYFRQNNPLVKYELFDHSDSLNYSVSIGQYTAYGSAFIHDFLGRLPDSIIESRFKISFHNVLRNLIMNVAHGKFKELREKIKFFTEYQKLDIDAVTEFIRYCTCNFDDLQLEYQETDEFHRWYFTSEVAGPFGFSLNKKTIADAVASPGFKDHGERMTQGDITNLLIRAFVSAESIEEATAKQRDAQNVSPDTAKLMADVREAVRASQVKREAVTSGLTV